MINSRDKGARAENALKKVLREKTGLNWERVPMSGGLNKVHKLKGDLYVPDVDIKYCVEVKHYKDDHLSSKILHQQDPMILKWWAQTCREAEEMEKEPLLFYKFDRSKWFVAQEYMKATSISNIRIWRDKIALYIYLLEDWLKHHEFVSK